MEIFFSAGHTVDSVSGSQYHAGSVVVFDKVLSQLGPGYDSTTGEFTCLTSGFYEFTLHLVNFSDKRGNKFQLMKNNDSIVDAFLLERGGSFSYSIIMQLEVGDVIKVASFGNSSLFSLTGNVVSIFSGQLISYTGRLGEYLVPLHVNL